MTLPNLLEDSPLTDPGPSTPIQGAARHLFPPFATQPAISKNHSKQFAPPFKSFSQQLNLNPRSTTKVSSPPRHSYSQREDIFSKMDQMSSSQGGTQTPLSGTHANPFAAPPQQRLDGCFARILGLDTSANVSREEYNHDMDEVRITLRQVQNTLQENTDHLKQQQQLVNVHRKKGDELRDRIMDLEDSHNAIQGRSKELSELIEQQAQILLVLSNTNNERWNSLTEQHERNRAYMGDLVHGVENRLGEKLEAELGRIRETVEESARQPRRDYLARNGTPPAVRTSRERRNRIPAKSPPPMLSPKSFRGNDGVFLDSPPARRAAKLQTSSAAVSLHKIDPRNSEEISVVSSVVSDHIEPVYSWSDDLGI